MIPFLFKKKFHFTIEYIDGYYFDDTRTLTHNEWKELKSNLENDVDIISYSLKELK